MRVKSQKGHPAAWIDTRDDYRFVLIITLLTFFNGGKHIILYEEQRILRENEVQAGIQSLAKQCKPCKKR